MAPKYKVKIFSESASEDLEKKVNNFLRGKSEKNIIETTYQTKDIEPRYSLYIRYKE